MARNHLRWMLRPVAHCKEGCSIFGIRISELGSDVIIHIIRYTKS